MPPLPAPVFGDELRRLDTPTFADFVADLWEAGGWDTEVDSPVVHATRRDRSPGSQTILLSHRGSDRQAPRIDPDVVVTSRRAARTETDEGTPVIDADDLYQRAVYGIDREDYTALCQRYFDRDGFVEPSSTAESPGALATAFEAVRSRASTPGAVVLVVLLVTSGGVIAASMASSNGVPTGSADTTATPETVTAVPTATPASRTGTPSLYRQQYRLAGCPPPPQGVHPAHLRPTVLSSVSATGLDGWELVSAINSSEARGPNALAVPEDPVQRHVASYRSPANVAYKVTIDRWESYPQAIQVGTQMAAYRDVVLVWGQYTFVVLGYNQNGTQLPGDRVRAGATSLLATVAAPDSAQLTEDCVGRITLDNASSDVHVVPQEESYD